MVEFFNLSKAEINVFILLLIAVIFFIINSSIKNNLIRVISTIFLSLFIIAQLISIYSTQTFIGYQFYVHANMRGVIGMQNLFIIQITIAVICFIFLIIINYYSNKIFRKLDFLINKNKRRLSIKVTKLITIVLLISIIIIQGNFFNDTKTLLSVFTTSNAVDFKKVIRQYNMHNYVTPHKIKSSAGKNIIIISLESIEKGFLSEKYAHLTPNLNKYKKSWNYYNISQNVGSAWTSGSLYTCLTGFPAFFGKSSNTIFQTTFDSKISSISHVLTKAGYNTTYMNGNARFSGVDFMVNALNFKKIIDYRSVRLDNKSGYGLRDKDLFELAKSEIQLQSKSNKPFALFISTTDTHYPNGIYDSRMENVISKKNSDLEFMVSAIDFMIEDFILYLKKNDILDNTVVYIFPDHLKMGNPKMFKDTGERGLYLITNAKNANKDIKPSEKLYQIDLPKMILNGADVKHNHSFFTDYIPKDKNKNQFIRENINKITAINIAGLSRLNEEKYIVPKASKQYEKYKKDIDRYIAHAGGKIDEYTNTNSLEALNLSYDKGFRLFELEIEKLKDGSYVALHSWENWKETTGYVGETPVSHKKFMNYKLHKKFTPLSIKEINQWFKEHPDAILITDKINEPKLFSKAFIDPKRLMMKLSSKQAVEEGCKIGILSAIPTLKIIKNMNWRAVKKLGIKHMVVSRFLISSNKELLKKLKNNNVKT